MHMRRKDRVKNGVHYHNATGPHHYTGGLYEKCCCLLSDAKRMNVTPPRFTTMHICVGRELIISFYLKLLQSHPHSDDTPQEGARWIHRQLRVLSVKLRPFGGLDSQSFLQSLHVPAHYSEHIRRVHS